MVILQKDSANLLRAIANYVEVGDIVVESLNIEMISDFPPSCTAIDVHDVRPTNKRRLTLAYVMVEEKI